jgi:hypothetical protein
LSGVPTTLAAAALSAAHRVSEKRAGNILSLSRNKAVATPQGTQDVQDARAAAIYSRPADYQPGVELFQQGVVAYQFAK